MKGHVRARGKSWEIRWHDVAGHQRTRAIRGTKAQADQALREELSRVDRGEEHVKKTRTTVAQWVAERIEAWHAKGGITARSKESYVTSANRMGLIANIPVQRLTTRDVENWQLSLRHLSWGSQRAVFWLLKRALADAVRHKLAHRNVAAEQGALDAGAQQDEVEYLTDDQLAALLKQLDGDEWYAPVVTAAFTGLRRNEQLALTWGDINLETKVLHVRRALDNSASGEITMKLPKTKSGVRSISLPDIVVEALRQHRVRQLENALLLGLGKPASDSVVFPGQDGGYDNPRPFSLRWMRKARKLGVALHWHGMRHSHASQLIHACLPLTVVAARLGHSSPLTTLKVYAHMFTKDNSAAAAAINKALGQ